MASFAPPASFSEPRTMQIVRAEPVVGEATKDKIVKDPGPAAKAAAERRAADQAQESAAMQPGTLVVEVDLAAGRFVSTLIDSQTKEMVWRYPSETQLAYSRAVKAYLRAVSGS